MTKEQRLREDHALMSEAAGEIRQLRHANEVLAAKVEVMELFAVVLNTSPAYRSQGASVDVVGLLEKRRFELETELDCESVRTAT
jgi:hypothetical protein